MTDKVIQLNIDELKDIIRKIDIVSNRVGDNGFGLGYKLKIMIDENKWAKLTVQINHLDYEFENLLDYIKDLKKILKQGGCEFG